MHVIDPAVYHVPAPRKKRWPYALAVLVVVVLAGAGNYLRPLPATRVTMTVITPAADTTGLSWPPGTQAAVAAENYGVLDTSGSGTPLPTASIAKTILALCVLEKLPLKPGEQGRMFTMDAHDVAIYTNYAALDGSLMPVAAGQQFSEYQLLQAIMLPSANNIADSLAAKVFGSQQDYAAYAAAWLASHGLTNTKIGPDASGFDPGTVSTASDLAQLGLAATQNPVLMEIVGQSSAVIPGVGTVYNYDTVLGHNGIDGIKTGNNAVDLGAFLFSATKTFGSTTVRFTGAVMGAPDLNTALQDGAALAAVTASGFQQTTVVPAGGTVGALKTAWGTSTPIVAEKSLTLVRWKATPITEHHTINNGVSSGKIGTLQAAAGPARAQTGLKLARPVTGPSFWWRLTRH